MPKTIHPTSLDQHTAYSNLYAYFNRKLFAGRLSPVLLNFSRHAKAFGFFAPDRWVRGTSKRHEISLNPNHLDRDHRATCATLVHEMVHAWQAEHGTPGRGGYHNAEWAAKMEAVGLMPSSTAAEGGAKTGDRVSHYVLDGEAFDRAFKALPKSYHLPWLSGGGDETTTRKAKPASKVKYTCPGCEANAWGKPGLLLVCGEDGCDGEAYVPGEATG